MDAAQPEGCQSPVSSCQSEGIVSTFRPGAPGFDVSTFAPRPSPLVPRAFTLVELMVVIGIIGLLIAIALPAFSNMITKSRATHTAATINTLNLGLEQFRAAEQLGGALPPSYALSPGKNCVSWVTPHAVNSNTKISDGQMPLQGANLLAWALVGADMLGTPGFKNANGAPDDTSGAVDFGGWTDDMGTLYAPAGVSGLYALNTSGGVNAAPAWSRQGPFVDTSKMVFPKPFTTGSVSQFVLDKVEGSQPTGVVVSGDKPVLASLCFLDTFNQPILYYKANIGKTVPVDSKPLPEYNGGVFNQSDNEYITGGPNYPGIDFGAGPNPAPYDGSQSPYRANKYHLLANSAVGTQYQSDIFAFQTPMQAPQGYTPLKGTMEYHFWNPAVNAAWRAQREDSYILLSAGPDGRFGTSDDIGNFQINP